MEEEQYRQKLPLNQRSSRVQATFQNSAVTQKIIIKSNVRLDLSFSEILDRTFSPFRGILQAPKICRQFCLLTEVAPKATSYLIQDLRKWLIYW